MLHVFDLDHTLVHSLREPLSGYDCFMISANDQTYFVHIRPHVLSFFQFLRTYDIAFGIWTAGTEQYLREVVNGLRRRLNLTSEDRFAKVCLSRKDATKTETAFVKDLSFFDRLDVVLYDDDPAHKTHPKNKGRVVLVPKFDVTAKHARCDCFFLTLRCELSTALVR